jgi:hypothetical protein
VRLSRGKILYAIPGGGSTVYMYVKLYLMTLALSTAIVDFHKGRHWHKKKIFTKREKYKYIAIYERFIKGN